jgi:threonine dehydrogenase-like Zn-dependent dehydrogenase
MQVRDVLYVDDLVDAFLLAEQNAPRLKGRAFNMGGGAGNAISLQDLLDRIERLHGKRPTSAFDAWRTGDQRYYVSDTSAFQRETGWQPRVGAEEGIALLFDWLRRAQEKRGNAAPPRERRLRRGRTDGDGMSMQAAVLSGPGRPLSRASSHRSPVPGQILVRMEGSGVCASSLPLWEGREWFTYPQPPGAPGHEGWGRVAALGEGVTGPRHRRPRRGTDLPRARRIRRRRRRLVVKLPDTLADTAVLGEPLGCATNIFQRSEIRAGQTVAIVGIGFLGALLTQLAKHAGARVIALSRRPFSLEFAKQAGRRPHAAAGRPLEDPGEGQGAHRRQVVRARHRVHRPAVAAGPGGRDDGRARPPGHRRLPPGRPAAGQPAVVELARHRRHQRARTRPAGLRGRHEARRRRWLRRRLDPTPLYTHKLPLDRLGEALELTRTRPDGFMKALVTT